MIVAHHLTREGKSREKSSAATSTYILYSTGRKMHYRTKMHYQTKNPRQRKMHYRTRIQEGFRSQGWGNKFVKAVTREKSSSVHLKSSQIPRKPTRVLWPRSQLGRLRSPAEKSPYASSDRVRDSAFEALLVRTPSCSVVGLGPGGRSNLCVFRSLGHVSRRPSPTGHRPGSNIAR